MRYVSTDTGYKGTHPIALRQDRSLASTVRFGSRLPRLLPDAKRCGVLRVLPHELHGAGTVRVVLDGHGELVDGLWSASFFRSTRAKSCFSSY